MGFLPSICGFWQPLFLYFTGSVCKKGNCQMIIWGWDQAWTSGNITLFTKLPWFCPALWCFLSTGVVQLLAVWKPPGLHWSWITAVEALPSREGKPKLPSLCKVCDMKWKKDKMWVCGWQLNGFWLWRRDVKLKKKQIIIDRWMRGMG